MTPLSLPSGLNARENFAEKDRINQNFINKGALFFQLLFIFRQQWLLVFTKWPLRVSDGGFRCSQFALG